MVKSRQPPILLARVLRALSSLNDSKGSTLAAIVERVRVDLCDSNKNTVPRDVTLQVRRALKHGVTHGLVQERAGKYWLKVQRRIMPVDSREIAQDGRARKRTRRRRRDLSQQKRRRRSLTAIARSFYKKENYSFQKRNRPKKKVRFQPNQNNNPNEDKPTKQNAEKIPEESKEEQKPQTAPQQECQQQQVEPLNVPHVTLDKMSNPSDFENASLYRRRTMRFEESKSDLDSIDRYVSEYDDRKRNQSRRRHVPRHNFPDRNLHASSSVDNNSTTHSVRRTRSGHRGPESVHQERDNNPQRRDDARSSS